MFCSGDQFQLNFHLLRGLAALGDKLSIVKQAQKQQLARLILADLIDPRNTAIDNISKIRYVAEIKMYCPDLFN
jgi:hypothetical protein